MKFKVIYADCPWSYTNKKTGGSHTSGAVQQYDVLQLAEIQRLPIQSIAEENSVLFLWATVPMLPEAMETMRAWGYTYKTKLTWDKDKYGMGFWFRGQIEELLVGIRGKVPPFRCQKRNRMIIKPTTHSTKPAEFRDLITEITTGPRVELFARQTVPGWTALGLSIDGKRIQDRLVEVAGE